MTEKRFTEIEHDYENAWIKCKDNGLFMIYPIYEDETGMPTLGDLLNGLVKENEELKQFQEQVAEVIESKMGDNVCNDYKIEVLKEIWNKLNLDEVWFK